MVIHESSIGKDTKITQVLLHLKIRLEKDTDKNVMLIMFKNFFSVMKEHST